MVLENANQENQLLGRIPKMVIIGFVDNESQETITAIHSDFGIMMQNLQPFKLMDNHIQLNPFRIIF